MELNETDLDQLQGHKVLHIGATRSRLRCVWSQCHRQEPQYSMPFSGYSLTKTARTKRTSTSRPYANGEPYHGVRHTVEAVLQVDGKLVTLKKTLTEKVD